VLSPIPASSVGLSVDPLLLASTGRPLAEAAAALRQALPGVDAAWLAAADALHGRRTGQSLSACRSGMQLGLAGCVAELEAFSRALGASATVYVDADRTALGSVGSH
jgi:hypothetical protein